MIPVQVRAIYYLARYVVQPTSKNFDFFGIDYPADREAWVFHR